jgi:3-hydroxybutyrate dehydrogenase
LRSACSCWRPKCQPSIRQCPARFLCNVGRQGRVAHPEEGRAIAERIAAKHGIVGLTKVVALENADRGITCNAICPGFVNTPLIQEQIKALAARDKVSIEQASQTLVGGKQPSKSFVAPEQIGAMAVFLSSDAAAQITGTALPLDGGWTAQ